MGRNLKRKEDTRMDFAFNPRNVSASIEVLPKGDYEVTVEGAKAFLNKDDKGNTKNFGVMHTLKVQEGSKKDKKIVFRSYFHNEGGQGIYKQFHMAANGFGPKDEDAYNAASAEMDFAQINFETGECGGAYKDIVGKRLTVSLDEDLYKKNPDDEGKPNQLWKGFRAIK